MDHDAFEKKMIDTVNHHAEEKNRNSCKGSVYTKKSFIKNQDVITLKRGLKRMGQAVITTAMFVIALLGFVVVATAPGYLAVFLFLTSVVATLIAFVLLYAQGITHSERSGDRK